MKIKKFLVQIELQDGEELPASKFKECLVAWVTLFFAFNLRGWKPTFEKSLPTVTVVEEGETPLVDVHPPPRMCLQLGCADHNVRIENWGGRAICPRCRPNWGPAQIWMPVNNAPR